MAQRGRPPSLLEDLDKATRARLMEALRSAANERPISLYRRFGLEQRGVKKDSFYRWVQKQRRRYIQQGKPAPRATLSELPAVETLARLNNALNEALDTEKYSSLSAIAAAMRAVIDVIRLRIDEAQDKAVDDEKEMSSNDLCEKVRDLYGVCIRVQDGAHYLS